MNKAEKKKLKARGKMIIAMERIQAMDFGHLVIRYITGIERDIHDRLGRRVLVGKQAIWPDEKENLEKDWLCLSSEERVKIHEFLEVLT